ncbi:MAG: hypothetical protein WAV28_12035 [Sedimentisphaerales bacterium]
MRYLRGNVTSKITEELGVLMRRIAAARKDNKATILSHKFPYFKAIIV